MKTKKTDQNNFPWRYFILAVTILFAGATGKAQPSPIPILVKVTDASGKSTLGELKTDEGDTIELMDLKTGKQARFQKSDLNDLRKGVSEKEAAETIGLAEFLVWKVRRVLPSGVSTGQIVQVDASSLYVSLGSSAGLDVGQELLVYRGNGELKNPDTGEVLGKQRRLVAKVTVTEAKEKASRVKLAGDLETELKVGDEVELSKKAKPIAILPFVDLNGDVRAGAKKLEEDLTTGLSQGGISIVERTFLDKVLNELGFQNTKLFDPDKAQRVGKQLGAYAVLVGSMSGSGYRSEANIRLVKVETGEILFATRQSGPPLGPIVTSGGAGAVSLPFAPNQVGWISLLDGRTLKGWDTPGSGDWRVTPEGAISNQGRRETLTSQNNYANFELSMEVKPGPEANASVYIRARGAWEIPACYDIKASSVQGHHSAGSITKVTHPNLRFKTQAVVRLTREYAQPNTWFSLHVIAIGNRMIVRINGNLVADYSDTNSPILSGKVALHQYQPGATVLFRNVMIRPLADDSTLALAQAKQDLP